MFNSYKQYSSTIITITAIVLFLIHPLLLFVVGCTIFAIILYKNRYKLIPEQLEEKTYITKERVHHDLPNIDIIQRGDMYMSEKDKISYLLSPKWKKLRQKVFQRDGYKCSICSSTKNLNCHHITYIRLGDEDLKDLTTLCGGSDGCHTKLHLKLGYDREGYYPPIN